MSVTQWRKRRVGQGEVRWSFRGPTIGWRTVALFVTLATAGFIFQSYYLQKHRPLIDAGVASAQQEGLPMYRAIGTPPGATPYEPFHSRLTIPGRGMWRGRPTGFVLEATWEAPGTYVAAEEFYASRLLTAGWKPAEDQISTLVREYWKDGWIA
jgi:hypothetical protein